MRITLTPWQAHVDGWKDCTRCGLHRTRSSVVLARGSVPCDVVFVPILCTEPATTRRSRP